MARRIVRTARDGAAVFTDRDGTLNVEVDYLGDVRQLRLLPGVAAGIRLLNQARVPVVITTNQSGVARGYFDEKVVEEINGTLVKRLRHLGAQVAGVYYCPHHPSAGKPPYRRQCNCRKPSPGLLRKAALCLGLDLRNCYSVGDMASDVMVGQRTGGKGILVLTGHGRSTLDREVGGGKLCPDHVARNFCAAARWIVKDLSVKYEGGGRYGD